MSGNNSISGVVIVLYPVMAGCPGHMRMTPWAPPSSSPSSPCDPPHPPVYLSVIHVNNLTQTLHYSTVLSHFLLVADLIHDCLVMTMEDIIKALLAGAEDSQILRMLAELEGDQDGAREMETGGYVSCVRVAGEPILPPVMTEESRQRCIFCQRWISVSYK